jgi:hypothetical protein
MGTLPHSKRYTIISQKSTRRHHSYYFRLFHQKLALVTITFCTHLYHIQASFFTSVCTLPHNTNRPPAEPLSPKKIAHNRLRPYRLQADEAYRRRFQHGPFCTISGLSSSPKRRTVYNEGIASFRPRLITHMPCSDRLTRPIKRGGLPQFKSAAALQGFG